MNKYSFVKPIQNKKGFLDISFSMIFAILVGGMIIMGAVFGLNKYISTEEKIRSATSGKELGIILTSFESASDETRLGSAEFPTETRIVSRCENRRGFGEHSFRVTEKVGTKVQEADAKISFENKYVFSDREVVGEKFYLFAKSFNFPYEVATIVYLTSADDKYCFDGSPRDVEKELRYIKQENIEIGSCNDKENEDAIKVCFREREYCDIVIDRMSDKSGTLTKGTDEYFFSNDALMYAAIFSDLNNYECGVERLISRTKSLSVLYREKSVLLRDRCDAEIISELGAYSQVLDTFEDSSDIFTMSREKDKIERTNVGECKLW